MRSLPVGRDGSLLFWARHNNKTTVIKCKRCPQCGQLQSIRREICKQCGYIFSFLCEGCSRDTNGTPFCKECSESGKYHWHRIENARKDDDVPPFCIPNWED